ncbi:MAG: thioredoxin family protein [Breznakia sp.]
MKLTNENFKEELELCEFALVLISGDGCANCMTMYPIVQEVAEKLDNLSVFNLDVDKTNYKINEYYDIEMVPTILFLYRGNLISKVKGYQPPEILQIYVETKMEEYASKNSLN